MKRLVAVLVLMAAVPAWGQALTAGQAIEKIHAKYPVPAKMSEPTVDTVKAGDLSVPVTGIATTFLDTMDVLREANRRGLNLVVTHEPTFYNHPDDVKFLANDPVYHEKLAFIEQHHLVVVRLHDGIHNVAPDPMAMQLVRELGWEKYLTNDKRFFELTIPPTTLLELSKQVEAKLGLRTMRVVGDPNLKVSHVVVRPGASGVEVQVSALEGNVEVLIAGEASEWETVEYVRDATAQGRAKGLILLGHQPSEEGGMDSATEELRKLFPGVKVEHLHSQQSMWSPAHPLPAK